MKPKRERKLRRNVLEEVEPRILYSADFAPSLAEAVHPALDAERRTVDASGEFTLTGVQPAAQVSYRPGPCTWPGTARSGPPCPPASACR